MLLAAALAGCAALPPGEPPRAARPMPETPCPGKAAPPAAPKPPRTIEQVGRYAVALDAALVKSEAARATCKRSLDALRDWINGGP